MLRYRRESVRTEDPEEIDEATLDALRSLGYVE